MNSFLLIIGLLLATCSYSEVVPSTHAFLQEEQIFPDFGNNTSIRLRSPNARLLKWIEQVKKLGGSLNIQQGPDPLQPARRIDAVITPQMRRTGTGPGVVVPGFRRFQNQFNGAGARCHILGAQLGGAGNVQANLFPGFQGRFNTPVMRECENEVAEQLGLGNIVRYTAELEYGTNYYPDSIRLRAVLNNGNRLFHVRIMNTPSAPLTNLP